MNPSAPGLPDDPERALEDRWLDEALALPPDARAAWLGARAADGPAAVARAARVKAALAELDADDGFLAPGGALAGPLFHEWRERADEVPDEAPALGAGTVIGAYRTLERIGAGGMGEVYRARDTRLGREVALKVLPAHMGQHPDRVARLRREARVLAALNHPNIGAIYELEEQDGVSLMVLELVEGPTLGERIASGPLPLDEALRIARQLVDALEAAHARGIVHRDLKPGNVKLTPGGLVKVLDFGLAKVLRDEDDDAGPGPPTLTSLGVVMGTAAYMSPEQVRGEPVDHRADMWAFGCVLYEMLTGRRAFDGKTNADVLAQVLEQVPPLDRLPAATPAAVRTLLDLCFAREPGGRLGHIGEARRWLGAAGEPAPAGSTRAVAGVFARRSLWRAWPAVLGLVFGGVISAVVMRSVMRPSPPPVARLNVPVPVTDELVTGALPAVALSPDGRTLVYRARRHGRLQLFKRSLDRADPDPIPGTENAMAPFFSPDGEWLAFDRDGALMRVAVAGGTPVKICDTGGGSSAATWTDRGDVLFAPTAGRGLHRVPASGGTPVTVTRLDEGRGDLYHALPEALPGGDAAVFTIGSRNTAHVAVVQLRTGTVQVLLEGRQARYVPSGHLVFVRDGALWVVPFDVRRLSLGGPPVLVLRGLESTGSAHFALARDGSLLYVPPRDLVPPRRLVWVTREGREEPTGLEPLRYERSSLSPDGTRVAVVITEGGGEDLWVEDLARGTSLRLTFDPGVDTAPVWTPDGRAVVFRSERDGGGLFRVPADGTGRPERLMRSTGPLHTPYAFTADGRTLLYTEFRNYRDQAIGALQLDGDRRATIIVDEPSAELRPALSPDGRWLAYQSDATGRFEVYVRPYPAVAAGKWQVSAGGGTSPQWAPDGRALFYFDGRAMVRVPTSGTAGFTAGPVHVLFGFAPYAERLGPIYSVSPDGRRFLMLKDDSLRENVAARRQLLLVQNWMSELATLLAGAP